MVGTTNLKADVLATREFEQAELSKPVKELKVIPAQVSVIVRRVSKGINHHESSEKVTATTSSAGFR
jgi:hypothetical protein